MSARNLKSLTHWSRSHIVRFAGWPMRRTPSDTPPGVRTERMHERAGRVAAFTSEHEAEAPVVRRPYGLPRSGSIGNMEGPRGDRSCDAAKTTRGLFSFVVVVTP